ncbi:MAG: hypothetical protein QXU74_00795 [Candidatus Aenigmatarchaeota archaeon]
MELEKSILKLIDHGAMNLVELISDLNGEDPFVVGNYILIRLGKRAHVEEWLDTLYKGKIKENIFKKYLEITKLTLGMKKMGALEIASFNEHPELSPHTTFLYKDYEQLLERLKEENKRKKAISESVVNIARRFVDEIKNRCEIKESFIRGSFSNSKPFIYYGDENKLKALSDIDIDIRIDPIGKNPLTRDIERKIFSQYEVVINPVFNKKEELPPYFIRIS